MDYLVCAKCASDTCEHVDGRSPGAARWRVTVTTEQRYEFHVLADDRDEACEAAEEALGTLVLRSDPDDEHTEVWAEAEVTAG